MKPRQTVTILSSAIAPTINKRRLMRDLNAVGRIGIGERGAVTRLVFSIKELRSRLVAGKVHPKDLTNEVDPQGTKLADVLSGLGISSRNLHQLQRPSKSLKAYLELHIEQGPILEAKGKRIGLVTSIAAPSRF